VSVADGADVCPGVGEIAVAVESTGGVSPLGAGVVLADGFAPLCLVGEGVIVCVVATLGVGVLVSFVAALGVGVLVSFVTALGVGVLVSFVTALGVGVLVSFVAALGVAVIVVVGIGVGVVVGVGVANNSKVATIDRERSMVTSQVVGAGPLLGVHAAGTSPLQPTKPKPGSGMARSVTIEPARVVIGQSVRHVVLSGESTVTTPPPEVLEAPCGKAVVGPFGVEGSATRTETFI
jgi:hypothetical protein